ncbi:hypothetical protein RN001_000303 [Aquatica leii]|uniref:Uncharacterized protein n=1 Tax=Aquatica leii TaxID=1421715 RepID=A0AAN7Q6Z0_9COLE|nr:hypothetical protein RN001_000303 [Aquatica leii]
MGDCDCGDCGDCGGCDCGSCDCDCGDCDCGDCDCCSCNCCDSCEACTCCDCSCNCCDCVCPYACCNDFFSFLLECITCADTCTTSSKSRNPPQVAAQNSPVVNQPTHSAPPEQPLMGANPNIDLPPSYNDAMYRPLPTTPI